MKPACESILKKIKYAVDKFSMLEKRDKVLVGFSGGKDSVVLLYALKLLSEYYGIELTAFHVNHGIRGKEALHDRDFCEDFCKKHGIAFAEAAADAVSYSKENGMGLEEGARVLRYNAFESYASQNNITKIATAHTSSDNLETVIFNLTRGSGADGLKGIPPVRDNIIRPLIYCSTEEILCFAMEAALGFVTDSTNGDTAYSRNNIRHNVIPHLKTVNPKVEEAVSRLCEVIRQDNDCLSSLVPDTDFIETDSVKHIHTAILSRTLIAMYKKISNNSQLSNININDIANILSSYSKNNCRDIKKISLPGKVDFVITPQKAYFEPHREKHAILQKHILKKGINRLEESEDIIAVLENENEIENYFPKNIYKKAIHITVIGDLLNDTIFVRGRNEGDSFSFSNMTKKVKKMMNEAKIPQEKRDRLPIFCDSKGIFWIPGFPIRDDKKNKACENSLHIYYLTQENTL